MVLCALSIFAIVALILFELVQRSQLTLHAFGFQFFWKTYFDSTTGMPSYWDPVNGYFSALPFVYGTLVSSFLSLVAGGPAGSIGVAIFLTEMCPGFLARVRWPFSRNCWPPFPASFMVCGRFLFSCRCCENMSIRY